MTDLELKDLRRERWRLNGIPIRTLEDARSFIESAGFCLTYPSRPPLLMPTFIGAWFGSDERLPRHRAFLDPEARDATDLMIRLLRDKAAYEANLGDENNALLISASAFPYFYTLVGERNPKQPPQPGPRSPYSELACDTYHIIHRKGPISKAKLLEEVGKGVSIPALDRSLAELWSKLHGTCCSAGLQRRFLKASIARSARRSRRWFQSIWNVSSPPISRNWIRFLENSFPAPGCGTR